MHDKRRLCEDDAATAAATAVASGASKIMRTRRWAPTALKALDVLQFATSRFKRGALALSFAPSVALILGHFTNSPMLADHTSNTDTNVSVTDQADVKQFPASGHGERGYPIDRESKQGRVLFSSSPFCWRGAARPEQKAVAIRSSCPAIIGACTCRLCATLVHASISQRSCAASSSSRFGAKVDCRRQLIAQHHEMARISDWLSGDIF